MRGGVTLASHYAVPAAWQANRVTGASEVAGHEPDFVAEVCLRTPDISVLALMVQDAEQPAGAGEVQTDFFKLLSEGGTIAQVVLVILLIFSAISWAVIFYKFWQFSRAERQTKTFLDVFRKSSKFSEVQAVCRTLTKTIPFMAK